MLVQNKKTQEDVSRKFYFRSEVEEHGCQVILQIRKD